MGSTSYRGLRYLWGQVIFGTQSITFPERNRTGREKRRPQFSIFAMAAWIFVPKFDFPTVLRRHINVPYPTHPLESLQDSKNKEGVEKNVRFIEKQMYANVTAVAEQIEWHQHIKAYQLL